MVASNMHCADDMCRPALPPSLGKGETCAVRIVCHSTPLLATSTS